MLSLENQTRSILSRFGTDKGVFEQLNKLHKDYKIVSSHTILPRLNDLGIILKNRYFEDLSSGEESIVCSDDEIDYNSKRKQNFVVSLDSVKEVLWEKNVEFSRLNSNNAKAFALEKNDYHEVEPLIQKLQKETPLTNKFIKKELEFNGIFYFILKFSDFKTAINALNLLTEVNSSLSNKILWVSQKKLSKPYFGVILTNFHFKLKTQKLSDMIKYYSRMDENRFQVNSLIFKPLKMAIITTNCLEDAEKIALMMNGRKKIRAFIHPDTTLNHNQQISGLFHDYIFSKEINFNKLDSNILLNNNQHDTIDSHKPLKDLYAKSENNRPREKALAKDETQKDFENTLRLCRLNKDSEYFEIPIFKKNFKEQSHERNDSQFETQPNTDEQSNSEDFVNFSIDIQYLSDDSDTDTVDTKTKIFSKLHDTKSKKTKGKQERERNSTRKKDLVFNTLYQKGHNCVSIEEKSEILKKKLQKVKDKFRFDDKDIILISEENSDEEIIFLGNSGILIED